MTSNDHSEKLQLSLSVFANQSRKSTVPSRSLWIESSDDICESIFAEGRVILEGVLINAPAHLPHLVNDVLQS